MVGQEPHKVLLGLFSILWDDYKQGSYFLKCSYWLSMVQYNSNNEKVGKGITGRKCHTDFPPSLTGGEEQNVNGRISHGVASMT